MLKIELIANQNSIVKNKSFRNLELFCFLLYNQQKKRKSQCMIVKYLNTLWVIVVIKMRSLTYEIQNQGTRFIHRVRPVTTLLAVFGLFWWA